MYISVVHLGMRKGKEVRLALIAAVWFRFVNFGTPPISGHVAHSSITDMHEIIIHTAREAISVQPPSLPQTSPEYVLSAGRA